jgi:DNA-binding FrmR family transcriptional regulator
MTTKEQHQKKLIARLRRVEGQVRGIQGMIGKDADCEAVAQQLAAARKALDRTFFEMVACSVEQQLEGATDIRSAHLVTIQMAQMLTKYG